MIVLVLACTAQEPAVPHEPPAPPPVAAPAPAAPAPLPPPLPERLTPPLVAAPDDGWIATKLDAISPDVGRCQKVLADKIPGIHGTVVLSFTVQAGNTTDVTIVADPSKDQHLGKCVAGRVRRAEFDPAASGTFEATWTFPK